MNPVLPRARPEDVAAIVAARTAAPAHHAAALAYMHQHPGTSYADAVAVAKGGAGSIDPHQAPYYHEAAMQYMFEHPGLSYDQAVAHVTAGEG